jgi:ethanolamine utilization microcompartment shell protein EutS
LLAAGYVPGRQVTLALVNAVLGVPIETHNGQVLAVRREARGGDLLTDLPGIEGRAAEDVAFLAGARIPRAAITP